MIKQHPIPPPEISGAILNDPEAAQFLGVTPRTLRLWRRKRGLPHHKITAKVIRYRTEDLHEWLNGFRVQTLSV